MGRPLPSGNTRGSAADGNADEDEHARTVAAGDHRPPRAVGAPVARLASGHGEDALSVEQGEPVVAVPAEPQAADEPQRASARPTTVPSPPPRATSGAAPGAAGRRLNTWSLRFLADLAAVLVGMAVVVPVGWASAAYAVLALVCLGAAGTYRRHLALSALSEAPRLFMAVGTPLLLLAALSPVVALPGSLLTQALVTGIAVLLGRALTYAVLRQARRTGRLQEPTIVVGAGVVGVELHRQLGEHPEYGLTPVGVVDDVPAEDGLPLLGGLADLSELIVDRGIRRVIVAYGPTGEQELVTILRSTVLHGIELHVVPRFFELGLAPAGPDIEDVWGIPIYRVRRAALRDSAWKVKRVIDVVVSSVLLVLLAPLLGLIAVLVRASSPGPVLFRQRRIGQHGQQIEVLKFRTLRVNTDADITWSVADDPRQTRVGRWLRRLSLDELPQLWNVLRGDMALVGPRPERPHFVSRFSAQITGYGDRHRLPAGLTGLAQVHGLRGDTSIEERARFDNSYIEHWSPWLDFKVMVLTVGAVIKGALGRPRPPADPD